MYSLRSKSSFYFSKHKITLNAVLIAIMSSYKIYFFLFLIPSSCIFMILRSISCFSFLFFSFSAKQQTHNSSFYLILLFLDLYVNRSLLLLAIGHSVIPSILYTSVDELIFILFFFSFLFFLF